jgi:hypothetical protein
MQQVWLALIGGLILGWLIEWIVDWKFWRRNLGDLREENQALRRQLADAQAQFAAMQAPPTPAPGAATVVPVEEAALVAPPERPDTTVPDTTVPDTAREEDENTLGVTAAPADPQAEGE